MYKKNYYIDNHWEPLVFGFGYKFYQFSFNKGFKKGMGFFFWVSGKSHILQLNHITKDAEFAV